MTRPKKIRAGKNVTYNFTPNVFACIERLNGLLEADTQTEVIRRCVFGVENILLQTKTLKGRLVILQDDGTVTHLAII